MTNLVMEMTERYVLSGLAMYAALFIGLMIRLTVLMFRGASSTSDAIIRGRRLNNFTNSSEKAPKWQMVIRYVAWPYGIIKILSTYLKIEPKLIKEMASDGR